MPSMTMPLAWMALDGVARRFPNTCASYVRVPTVRVRLTRDTGVSPLPKSSAMFTSRPVPQAST